jgi:ABC-type branched-subunit amino acid transport system substrate-binding protein
MRSVRFSFRVGIAMGRLRRCAVVALLLLAGACTPQPTLPEETFEPIKIGIVTSLSGSLMGAGPGWRDAARLAVLEANAAGGPLPGRRIEVVVADDRTDSTTAAGIAENLVFDEEVVGIIGAAASSISLGIREIATQERVPQVSCCSTSDTITARNGELPLEDRFFFRTIAPDILQSQVVVLAAEDLVCTHLAILHLDDDYGTPFGMAIETSYLARGGTVARREPFADGQASYTTEVRAVRDALPDCTVAGTTCCIAVIGYPQPAAEIVRNWNAETGGAPVTWIGTDGVREGGFVDAAVDPSIIDGFYGTSPITDAPTPGYDAFVQRYRAVFGSDPIPYSSNQYDAMSLLILAIARAGSTDGDAVRDALREVSMQPPSRFLRAADLVDGLSQLRAGMDVDYEGASGNVDFDELGNVVSPFEIWRYDAPSQTPCTGASVLTEDRGSFCRIRTISAEEIEQ